MFFMLNNVTLKSLTSLIFLPNYKGVININLLLRNIATRILVTPGLETGKKISLDVFCMTDRKFHICPLSLPIFFEVQITKKKMALA